MDSSVEDKLSVEELTEGNLDEVPQQCQTTTQHSQNKIKNKGKATPNFHVGVKVLRLNIKSRRKGAS